MTPEPLVTIGQGDSARIITEADVSQPIRRNRALGFFVLWQLVALLCGLYALAVHTKH